MATATTTTAYDADLTIRSFWALRAAPPGSPLAARLVSDIMGAHLHLAAMTARRYAHRGESMEDLVQVACVGLLKAVAGYQPDRGVRFVSYALPTITGEVKRHFRDRTWGTHVPRRLQELILDVNRAATDLPQRLGRMPDDVDIATHLGVPVGEVREAQRARAGYRANSLSVLEGSPAMPGLERALAVHPAGYDAVDDHLSLQILIGHLPERQRRILGLRFVDELSQAEIATRIGVSQMHVSRLLASALRQLREGLLPV